MPTRHAPRAGRRGFTLAELMVVVVIIGLLATLVVPNVLGNLGKAQVTKAKADLAALAGGIKGYAIQNAGRYPESLEQLVTPDETGSQFLEQDVVPADPWGHPYVYSIEGSDFDLLCTGADGELGGEGLDRDISWRDVRNGTQ